MGSIQLLYVVHSRRDGSTWLGSLLCSEGPMVCGVLCERRGYTQPLTATTLPEIGK